MKNKMETGMERAGTRHRWMELSFLLLLILGTIKPAHAILRVAHLGPNPCSDALDAVFYQIGGSTTLQTVIDASASGDNILICAGEYFDNMVITDKTLVIAGQEDPNGENAQFITTLNGNDVKRPLEFRGAAAPGYDLTITRIRFFKGKATANPSRIGGGILFQARALTVNECLFEDNDAGSGGAIYGWGAGSVGELKVNNSTFTLNTAQNDGGAIFSDLPTEFDNVDFIENTSEYSGGAVLAARNLDVDASEFIKNISGSGGAIEVQFNNVLIISSSIFTDNEAIYRGGAISATSNTSTINNSEFTSNEVHNSSGGSENGKGGAVNFYDHIGDGITCNGDVTISNTEFRLNESEADGGALAFEYHDDCGGGYGRNASIDLSTFRKNSAIGNGGGIHSTSPLFIKRSNFEYNDGIDGAGIHVAGTLTMETSTFSNNTAGGSAAAIYLDGQYTQSDITDNCLFIQNKATMGTAVMEVINEHINLTDAIFVKNTANDAPILRINLGEGPFSVMIDRSIFRENTTSVGGPYGASTIEMPIGSRIRNSLLHHNYTANHVLDGLYYITNCTIYNNRPTDDKTDPIYQVKTYPTQEPFITNTIIWNGDFLDTKTRSLDPSWTLTNHSMVKVESFGSSNQFQNPGLKNPDFETQNSPFDFKPTTSSSVVNQGFNSNDNGEMDLARLDRVFSSVVDIGAYELQETNSYRIFTETKQGAGEIMPDKTIYGSGENAFVSVTLSKLDDGSGSELEKIVITDLLTGAIEEKNLGDFQVGTGHEREWIYPIFSISRNYKIDAYFKLQDLTVTVKILADRGKVYDENNNLVLSAVGETPVVRTWGTDVSMYFRPDPGYYVSLVTVDGQQQGDVNHIPHSATIEDLKTHAVIEVTFAACGTPPEIEPSFVMATNWVDPVNPQYSVTYSDGFGRAIQSQKVSYNDVLGNKRVVGGGYWDRNGRPIISVLPYVEITEGEDFEFIPMACRELVGHSNAYHDGGDDENEFPKRNAEGFAFSETVYKNRPGSVVQKSGAFGFNRSIIGHSPMKWSFTTNLPKAFFPVSSLNEAELNRRYDSQMASGTQNEYQLIIEKDADDNYSQSTVDKFGNVVATWTNPDQENENAKIVVENKYDVLGNNLKVTLPSVSGQPSQVNEKSFNQKGQLQVATAPDYGTVETKFDSLGRIRFTKDALQARLSDLNIFEEAIGYFTIRNYDTFGRMVSIGLSISASDDYGKPNLPTTGSIRQRFIYDKISDIELEAMGLPSSDIQNFRKELEHTENRLIGSIAWDENGIPTSEVASYFENGKTKASYKLIPGLPIQKFQFEYTDAGLFKKRRFYSGYVNSGNNLSWNEKSVKEVEHNENLEPKSISEGGLKFLDYSHNYLGDLQKKNIYFSQNSPASETMVYERSINGLSKIKSGDLNDRYVQTITYDREQLPNKYFTGKIQSNSYQYKTADNQTPTSEYLEYEYNGINQLAKLDKTLDGNFQDNYGEYEFDAMGRFVKKVEGGKIYDLFRYETGKNQLLAIGNDGNRNNQYGNFAYDPNGNMVLDRYRKMTVDYDYTGMATRFRFYNTIPDINLNWISVRNGALASLSGVEEKSVVEMTYDIGGQRVLKIQKEGGVVKSGKAYVGDLAVYAKENANPFELAHVNWVTGGGVTGKTDASGNQFFYIKDNQGSSRVVIKSDQTYQQVMNYDAYGNIIHTKSPPNGSASIEETYTGKEFDKDGRVAGGAPESGIDAFYFGARYYDPELGLWFTPDPAKQFLNCYSFGGNPVNTVDEDGRWVHIVVGAVIGAGVGTYMAFQNADNGWEALGYVVGGAAVGAASAATGGAVGAWAGGGVVGGSLGGAAGGAVSGFGNHTVNAGIENGEINPSQLWDATWKGSVSGAAGGLVGGAVANGPYGAFAGGFTSGATGAALNGAGRGEILQAGLIGGATSVWAFKFQESVRFARKTGDADFDREDNRRAMSRESEKSFRGKSPFVREHGGWLRKNGEPVVWEPGDQRSIAPSPKPRGATADFHTHPNEGGAHSDPYNVNSADIAPHKTYVIGRETVWMHPGTASPGNSNLLYGLYFGPTNSFLTSYTYNLNYFGEGY